MFGHEAPRGVIQKNLHRMKSLIKQLVLVRIHNEAGALAGKAIAIWLQFEALWK